MQMPKRFGYAVATICVGCCIWTAGADGVQAVDAVHALSSRRHQGIPSVAISPANGRRWCVWYASKTGDEDSNNYLIVATAPGDGPSWREVLVIDPDGEGPRRAFDPEIWFSPDGLLRIFWTERMAPLAANTTAKGSGCLADPKNDELWMLTLNGECEPDVAELALPRKIARGVMMCKPIVLKDGQLSANGRPLVSLEPAQWCDLLVEADFSEKDGLTWRVVATPVGGAAVNLSLKPHDNRFSRMDWIGWMTECKNRASCYFDDLGYDIRRW